MDGYTPPIETLHFFNKNEQFRLETPYVYTMTNPIVIRERPSLRVETEREFVYMVDKQTEEYVDTMDSTGFGDTYILLEIMDVIISNPNLMFGIHPTYYNSRICFVQNALRVTIQYTPRTNHVTHAVLAEYNTYIQNKFPIV
jgi:hypothetical protein